jgi:hypothetical protein
MKTRTQKTMIGLTFLLTLLIPVLWAGAIDWIQYNERLSGENSPLYGDILNRPAKQIWDHYTSEHTITGTHKPWIFPTPIPTATPQPTPTPGIDWTNATANFKTTGDIDISASSALKPKIYFETSAPDIPSNSFAFWVDSYSGEYWLILDQNGSQKKVQLQ